MCNLLLFLLVMLLYQLKNNKNNINLEYIINDLNIDTLKEIHKNNLLPKNLYDLFLKACTHGHINVMFCK